MKKPKPTKKKEQTMQGIARCGEMAFAWLMTMPPVAATVVVLTAGMMMLVARFFSKSQ